MSRRIRRRDRELAALSRRLDDPAPECRALALVALAVAWPPTARQQDRMRHLASVVDWDLLLATAERHRVAGLVAHGLAAAGVVASAAVAPRLRARAAEIAMRELACAGEARRLDGLLRTAGIAPVTLKGVAVAMLAFGRLGLRQNHDIDLLVLPEEMDAALATLAGAGYDPVGSADPRDAQRPWSRRPKDTPLLHRDTGLLVELHHRLFENAHLLARRPDERRAIVALPGGAPLETFGRSATIVYLSVHAAQHLWSRLKWLADIRALLAKANGEAMLAAYAEADRQGVRVALAATLLLCAILFGDEPDRESLRDWRRSRRVRIIVRLAVTVLLECGPRELEDIRFGSTRKNLAHYLLAASPRYLLRELAFDLADDSNTHVPKALAWLGPMARPLVWASQRVWSRGTWTYTK